MKKKYIIIGLVALILVILIAIGIVIFKNNDSVNEKITDIEKNISGKYSDVVVKDLETAKDSLEDVKNQLKISSVNDELKGEKSFTTGKSINTYKLKQTYNGIEVYNSGLIVYTDKQGNTRGIINNYKENINVDINPKSTDEDLKKVIANQLGCEESKIANSKLVVYQLENNNYVLAHVYEINDGLSSKKVVISDKTKEILEEIDSTHFFTESYMKDFLVNNQYVMTDNVRHIKISQANDTEMRKFVTEEMTLYSWDSLEEALAEENEPVVQAIDTVRKCYDYYKEELGYVSLDGDGQEEIHIITGLQTCDGEYRGDNACYTSPRYIVLGSENVYNDKLDVIGHEYAHAALEYFLGSVNTSYMESQAITEAYPDILGMCVEAHYENFNIDGIMCEEIPEHSRNIKDSTVNYSDIDSFFDSFLEDMVLKRGKYYYSQIISRAAYIMSKSLTLDELETLWFDSMQLLDNTPSFYECEYAVRTIAREMNLSEEKQAAIKNAFVEVGIVQYYNVPGYTGPEEIKDKSIVDEIENAVENSSNIGLNSELKNVYSFAIKSNKDGNSSSIVALKEDGTEQKIVDTGSTKYEAIDYSYGKVYLQKGTEFYSVDLTKGNGNYTVESIYKVTSETDWYNKNLYVYDGIMYFNQGGSKVVGYDLQTKKLKEVIASIGEHGKFVLDKDSGTIYYGIRNTFYYGGVIGKYDIEAKQNTELFREKFATSEGTRLELGPLTDNGIIIFKTKSSDYITVGYEYNVNTKKQTKIDSDMNVTECVYADGKIYYVKDTSIEVSMQNSLKVYDNGTIKDIVSPMYDEGMSELCILKNGKIQLFQSRGQSEDSYSSNIYLIDKNTLAKTEVFDIYEQISYVVDGSDKYTVREADKQTNTIAKEDLIGKWKATGTNSVENSLFMLFGSSISMANSLEFKQDGTYSLGVGFSYGENGNYEIQGDTIKLTNIKDLTDNPDVSQRGNEAELKIKQEDGKTKVILEHKLDVYDAGKVSETLNIEIIFEKQ